MKIKVDRTILTAPVFFLCVILAAAAGWKFILMGMDVFPFNSDEAIVALMARHILQGERPVFFYGQAYMGSLDAYLVAAGFFLFGQQVWVIRLVQLFLYLGTIITTVLIGKVGFQTWNSGLFAGILLAIPAVNVTLYTTVSLGGYGEAMLLGALSVLLATWLHNSLAKGKNYHGGVVVALWGLIAGLGLWANGLSLVFTFPSGCLVLYTLFRQQTERKKFFFSIGLASIGFFFGSLPWWIFALQNGFGSLVGELFGSAVSVESGSFFLRVGNHLINFLLFGSTVLFGIRPPWEIRWLALPLAPVVLVFWVAVGVYYVRHLRKDLAGKSLLLTLSASALILILAFLLTSFGIDPSGRYFLPLAIPMALAAGLFISQNIKKRLLRILILSAVIGFHGWGTLTCAFSNPPGITTQFDITAQVDMTKIGEVREFLLAHEVRAGYTNYWIAYPLAFLSSEELIFVPKLPYHEDLRYTPRDNRYASYNTIVEKADKVAYIASRNPGLDRKLQEAFTREGLAWKEQKIGDFTIFYNVSRHIKPEELDLYKK